MREIGKGVEERVASSASTCARVHEELTVRIVGGDVNSADVYAYENRR
jgi:hypothetical protein